MEEIRLSGQELTPESPHLLGRCDAAAAEDAAATTASARAHGRAAGSLLRADGFVTEGEKSGGIERGGKRERIRLGGKEGRKKEEGGRERGNETEGEGGRREE